MTIIHKLSYEFTKYMGALKATFVSERLGLCDNSIFVDAVSHEVHCSLR